MGSGASSRDPSPLEPLVGAIEEAKSLDKPATLLAKAVRGALSPGTVKDALSGTWLGHPLHPALTDVVIGSLLSATTVDLLMGSEGRMAARRLIGLGAVVYVPTALAGASDWIDGESDTRVKRVGIVHAGGNLTALALYAASARAHRREATGRGRLLSAAGAAVLMAGGYLGGHMSFRRGVGPDRTIYDPGPADWTRAAAESELTEGRPLRVLVEDTPVLLLSSGDAIHAIHDRCSHRGCSLSEGEVEGWEIVCPCHFSRFDLRDGSLVRGPATAPQPSFEVRRHEGAVEVRLAVGS